MAKQFKATHTSGRRRTYNNLTWGFLSESERKNWTVEKEAKEPAEVKTKKEDK
ncbi:hypothetical protein [Pontibacter beigongshangensis]|uniref:hypothetical protein n=1 Tax=Pontibacter beigongshangensis TaxID=2574733 RepID=UPI0016509C5B|nr:hypothetical protein [Pontibacter beigongshangensis]